MFLHGGDYNPEQWIDNPQLIKKDVQKLKAANINTVTLGMFNWSILEPREGEFNTSWLIDVLDTLRENDMQVIIGTPTAARPHWLAQKYVETSRVNKDGVRELSGFRHNHCMTSPQFREKVAIVIELLIDIVSKYDNIHSWHINNEFGGECYCEHCQNKFRNSMKGKYGTIEELNKAWWNTFWSHNYSSFEEIQAPMNHGELSNTPLKVNWTRFSTENHIGYYLFEKEIIQSKSDLPITTNFHGEQIDGWMDYYEFAKHVDYVSYDIYPEWDTEDNYNISIDSLTNLLIQSSLDKNKDFYIMESSPGSTNWQRYTILKSGKLHEASSYLQMLAGSKSFLYFQLKQSRGSSEKYHGSVLDINSNTEARVYNYVSKFGKQLTDIHQFSDAKLNKEVAIYYDWNNSVMLSHSEGPRNQGLHTKEIVNELVEYFVNVGINVQFVFDEVELEKFHTVIFPYSYSVKAGVIEKLKKCENTNVIAMPLMNYVNEDDLLHMGTLPHNINTEFGIKVKEFNAIVDGKNIESESYKYKYLTEVVECITATELERFDHEILESAITCNVINNTSFYYIAGMLEKKSLHKLFDKLFDNQYDESNKLVRMSFELENEIYEYIINFGHEVVDLALENIVWSTSDVKNKLCRYDFCIVKKILKG